MSNRNRKKRPFEVDRTARAARRAKLRTVKQTHILQKPTGEIITGKDEYETSPGDAEARQVLVEAARSFIGPFEIKESSALSLLLAPNPHGKPNSDVIVPWVNGKDITQRSRHMFIIDFGLKAEYSDVALYESAF